MAKKKKVKKKKPARKAPRKNWKRETEYGHLLLDAAGIDHGEGSLVDRIVKVAERWLSSTQHSGSCSCRPCAASRAMMSKAIELGLRKPPTPPKESPTPETKASEKT